MRDDAPMVTARLFTLQLGANERNMNGWKRVQYTFDQLRVYMLTHNEQREKSGFCFVPGEIAGRQRTKKAIKQIDCLVFDCDGLQKLVEVVANLRAHDVYAFVYTSFSHLSRRTFVETDKYRSWAKSAGKPDEPRDADDIADYFKAQGKTLYTGIKFDAGAAPEHTEAGISYVIDHDPVEKFRVVIPLATPIVLAHLSRSTAEACNTYADIVRGAARTLGIELDPSCTDASRLWYRPAHPPGARFETVEVAGKLLDWSTLPRASKTKAITTTVKKPALNACVVTDRNGVEVDLTRWDSRLKRKKIAFAVADVIYACCGDRVMHERANGGYVIHCPFEHQHSQPGGEGTFCDNGNGTDRLWTIHCSHNGCVGRTPLDFLAELVRLQEITARDIEAEAADTADDFNPLDQPDPPGVQVSPPAIAEQGRVAAAETGPIDWLVREKNGKPDGDNVHNVAQFLDCLGVKAFLNEFSGRVDVIGLDGLHELNDWTADYLWVRARALGLPCTDTGLRKCIQFLANEARRHPVLEYLRGVRWDRKPRIDTWLSAYAGVPDNALTRAFGRNTLLSAVRRVLEPGCKADEMLVLEGPQGAGKSELISILGGEWYGDGLKLGMDAKQTIEAIRGRWIVEAPELTGLTSREVEQVKHQISCRIDHARAAYARTPESVARQCIFIGTTNDERYLRDQTGNRRFCPVTVGRIDLVGLARDRDQLWAETLFAIELLGAPNGLPEELWASAAGVQADRVIIEPIEESVTAMFESCTSGGIVAKEDIWRAIGRRNIADRSAREAQILTKAMKKLGWMPGRRRREGGRAVEVYQKHVRGAAEQWLEIIGDTAMTEAEAAAEVAALRN